jgi:hypothetical protein
MSIANVPLELRCGQHVDAVMLGVRADKFHESDLPAEVESNHQTIISPRNLKPDALAVQYLGVRSRLLSLFRALMVIGPRVTKHRFDDVWMIKV